LGASGGGGGFGGFGLSGGGFGAGFGAGKTCWGGGTTISGGGKYWLAAGSGAAKATSAAPAANRTALAFMDAFLAGDPLLAQREASRRQPAQENPSGPPHPIRLFASPVAHRIARWRALNRGPDDFLPIAPTSRRPLSYHNLRKKKNSRTRREK